ncbi:TPA: hypothetical protein NGR42_001015 [Vibrio parahaemolyticus]|nr:hypothetical protein [Vibrio parahaemolyticus]EGQ9941180.1 hypothetical protein [Vibrio parahaemolyticus]EJL7423279.1 hypothetical protein [Vibrio parahaemolyticus]ELA7070060.1 hypothetical protein [Vibrio parahaemolyticus]ELI1800655.1 hypothetical protein [Vibrio parahaemolyticus]
MNTISTLNPSSTSTSTVQPVAKIKTRNRTIYYYRAETNNKLSTKGRTFESALVASWNALGAVKKRIYSHSGKIVFGMDMEKKSINTSSGSQPCYVFTIGVAEKGAEASILNVTSGNKSKLASNIHKAPSGHEYLDGEAFVCVYGNNILVSPCDALRGSIPNRFLRNLLKRANDVDQNCFNILQVANVQVLQTVMTEGIKRIDLNASVFMADYEYHKANVVANSFPDKLAAKLNGLVDLITPNQQTANLTNYDSLHARLSISQDMRVSTSNSATEGAALTDNAKELVQSGLSGFALVTRDGKRITPDKVVMNETITVERYGKSVKTDSIWAALVNQMQKYYDSKLLL